GNVPDGAVVLVDRLAYHSHYAALVQTQALAAFEVRLMPSLPDGTVDLAALDVPAEVNAVCATMIGTHCGNVNPIAEIGAAAPGARRRGRAARRLGTRGAGPPPRGARRRSAGARGAAGRGGRARRAPRGRARGAGAAGGGPRATRRAGRRRRGCGPPGRP